MCAAQNLLNYLSEKNLSATFFAVGSRCLERPAVLLEEYMSGHEVSVHTWSHHVSGAHGRPSAFCSHCPSRSRR
jgi:peptidoglycan/xylan/chitin deacetylase (PgdA/CDA1 family)